MAETLSTDCGSSVGSAIAWKYGTTSGDLVPGTDSNLSDLTRGLGMSLTGTAAAPAPARALANQLLPTGVIMVQTVPGAETNTFTTRVAIGGTYVNLCRIGGTQTDGTIPAGALNILGRTIEVIAWGTLGTTGTPNLTLDIGLGAAGANVLATTGVCALTATTSPRPWILRAFATVTTAGASGVVNSGGTVLCSTGASNLVTKSYTLGNSTPGTGLTVDLTAALAFNVFATCGTSNLANRIRQYGCIVKILG